jgi:hypothetical protein
MNLVRRRFVAGTLAAGSLAAGSLIARRPADAVIVQDDTWRAEGGGALMASSEYRGEQWGYVSSTWIGNVQGRGRLLTAAHAFEANDTADVYSFRTPTGKVRRGTDLVIHPLWDSSEDRTGYDFAIVTLDAPVEDAGAPPLLYSGNGELGKRIVMIGFGRRGIGSVGQDAIYSTGSGKAAAENTVDEVENAVGGRLSKGEDAGNWFGVTFHPLRKGGSRMDGILGSGDSGGSAWLSVGSGWAVCGVNSNGTGDAKYDDQSYFARVSDVAEWLAKVVPGVRFAA